MKHTVSLTCVKQALKMRQHGWFVKFSSKACSVGYADLRLGLRPEARHENCGTLASARGQTWKPDAQHADCENLEETTVQVTTVSRRALWWACKMWRAPRSRRTLIVL